MFFYFKNRKSGFTLIEMIVVVAVFSLLVILTTEVFISFYNISNQTNFSKDITQNLRYSLDTITREARDSYSLEPYVSDRSYYGADELKYIPAGWDMSETNLAGSVKITKRSGSILRFYCENEDGVKCSSDNPGHIWQSELKPGEDEGSEIITKITSENILITKFEVLASGSISEGNFYNLQPKVTVLAEARSNQPDRTGNFITVTFRSSASRRNYKDAFSHCDYFSCSTSHVTKALSNTHSLLLKADGSLWAAGGNNVGQLGLGYSNVEGIPTFTKASINSVKDISISGQVTLVVKSDGTIWGVGNTAQTGGTGGITAYENWTQGGTEYWLNGCFSYGPIGTKISDAISISSSVYNAHVIRGENREIWGSGFQYFGNSGGACAGFALNNMQFIQTKKMDGTPMTGAIQVDVSTHHSIALTDNGKVWILGCWDIGAQSLTRCGGTQQRYWREISDLSDKNIVRVRVTSANSYAISSSGDLWFINSSGTWVKDQNSSDVFDILGQSGSTTATMIKTDGSLYVSGWMGSDRITWNKDTSISDVVFIGRHLSSRIIIQKNGQVKTIGVNAYGQLGIGVLGGTYTTWQTPVVTAGF